MYMFFSNLNYFSFSENSESALKPYQFKMEEIEGFRYRCRVSLLVSAFSSVLFFTADHKKVRNKMKLRNFFLDFL